jgi:hypothetical protein
MVGLLQSTCCLYLQEWSTSYIRCELEISVLGVTSYKRQHHLVPCSTSTPLRTFTSLSDIYIIPEYVPPMTCRRQLCQPTPSFLSCLWSYWLPIIMKLNIQSPTSIASPSLYTQHVLHHISYTIHNLHH